MIYSVLPQKPFRSYLWLSLWLFFFVIFTLLGFWQLHRYTWKKQLIETYVARIQAHPLNERQLNQPADLLLYHRVRLSGEMGRLPNLYWQNRYYHEIYGYHVLTPLWIAATQKYLLVDRGFITKLPNSPINDSLSGQNTVTGVIYYPDRADFILGADISTNSAGQILLQKLDFDRISHLLHAPIYPFLVNVQSPLEADKSYPWPTSEQNLNDNRRQLPAFFANILPPSRHMGYAVQWFAMACVLAIAIIIGWFRRE